MKKYTTAEVRELFEIENFLAPWVICVRKSDNQKGSMEFTHSPRLYFNFIPDVSVEEKNDKK